MLSIAICDDEMVEIKNIIQALYIVLDEKVSLDYYTDYNELLDACQAGKEYDIYFLDILMPGMTGINVAHLINEYNRDALIVFITSSREYALEAFGVKAVRYLLKPIEHNALKEAIDYCKSLMKNTKKTWLVKTQRGIVTIDMNDITYIESYNRAMNIHKSDGSTILSSSLRSSFEDALKEILENPVFIQVHKSYVVNMNYVDTYGSSLLYLEDGDEIPISKNKSKDVKTKFLKFMADRNKL